MPYSERRPQACPVLRRVALWAGLDDSFGSWGSSTNTVLQRGVTYANFFFFYFFVTGVNSVNLFYFQYVQGSYFAKRAGKHL